MRIDLNADVGEGRAPWMVGPPPDDELLTLVTSANVAAGLHAGSAYTIARTCATAVRNGVAIGVHPSYDDREGFGRRPMDVSSDLLYLHVHRQVEAVCAGARGQHGRAVYVKPHGALYHAIVTDEVQARAVVDAVHDVDPSLALLGPPGAAVLELAAEAGLRAVREGFVDRGYRADGTLVPRGEPGAMVTDPAVAAERAVRLATEGTVVAADGAVVELAVESLCVHSDTPGAVAIAAAVRAAPEDAGVEVRPFATP